MNIILFCQYYRTRDPKRQEEIDACLRGNLNHSEIDRAVIFVEPGAPALPPSRAKVDVIPQSQRLTYADWLRLMRKEQDSIGILVNADIELGESLANLMETMNSQDTFMALSRYNINTDSTRPSLNDYPQWTQDTWGVRSDAPITENLLHLSNFPLGYPGCDNRVAYVMWSHGFKIKNPCYHLRSLHRHQETTRTYHKEYDRLFGGATYVHPSLSPEEESELEHTIWTRSTEKLSGLLINQQCVNAGTHKLLPVSENDAAPFQLAQTFIGLSWSHHCLGSVHAKTITPNPDSSSPDSEDAFFLPLVDLLFHGISLELHQPCQLVGGCLRLPRRSSKLYHLLLQCNSTPSPESAGRDQTPIEIYGGGQRNFLSATAFAAEPLQTLHLKLVATTEQPEWEPQDGCELVLFTHKQEETALKSLELIAEQEANQPDTTPALPAQGPIYTWILRSQLSLDLNTLDCVASFGHRFRILDNQEFLYFEDRYWPSIGCTPAENISYKTMSPQELFLWGFCQPTLSLRQDRNTRGPRFAGDCEYWDQDDRTEEDAFNIHQLLPGPQCHGSTVHLYLSSPWCTYINLQRNPEVASQAIHSRIKDLRDQLAIHGLSLQTHTVCQHTDWQQHGHLFKESGIDTLWLVHKMKAQNEYDSIQLRAWYCYPTHAREAGKMDGLVIRDPGDKPFLATFQSAATSQASGNEANNLVGLKNRHRFHIAFADKSSIKTDDSSVRKLSCIDANSTNPSELDFYQRYNRLLSDSIFSLCPAGRGSNPARFWEAMAVGSIPILLNDSLELPELASLSQGRFKEWQELILIHPEADLESLPERLQKIPQTEIESRSQYCRDVMVLLQDKCCFGGPIERNLPGLQTAKEPEINQPLITIPQYGPEDRHYWRSQKCAFYDVVLEWYMRGHTRITFSDNGYFWWGDPGDILLFERDLIINLEDGKKDPPRWPGYVEYKHAFFANQYHLVNSRNHKLTYWGYAPVKLEQARQQLGRHHFSERTIGSFFAGSIENETQEHFRQKFTGWENYIDVYACADKINLKQSNRYSQEEYLTLISQSKFGVCFHGNAPKCYREIEYLALGTPLIITDGVEINYPEPLIEGLHYLRAHRKEEIPQIIKATNPEQWEKMSQACWEWFDRNASIDSIFKYLKHSIGEFEPECQRHRTVYILTDPDSTAASLAARSLQIVDPGARVEACEVAPPGALVLNPNDLVINELPRVGHEHNDKWQCESSQIESFLPTILHSAHPQHQKLCTLLGLRLRNFKIEINGPDGPINPFSRLEDGKLRLKNQAELAKLRIDFDWTRRCEMKYPHITHTIAGPASIEQANILAIMEYRRKDNILKADFSDHFNDYYAIHSKLIPANELARVCKLWMYTNCEIVSITGLLCDREYFAHFHYQATKPLQFHLSQSQEPSK
jgi:Exostosin family